MIEGEGDLSAPPVGGPGILGQIGHLAGQLTTHIGRSSSNAGEFDNIKDDCLREGCIKEEACTNSDES